MLRCKISKYTRDSIAGVDRKKKFFWNLIDLVCLNWIDGRYLEYDNLA
jgi:hypothetical protein